MENEDLESQKGYEALGRILSNKQTSELVKVNFTPETELENCLSNEFNIEIYNNLTEIAGYKGLFDPLDFLNILYQECLNVRANSFKPLSVTRHLFSLDLSKEQIYLLLYYLLRLLKLNHNPEYGIWEDPQILICCNFIEKEYKKLEMELYPKEDQLEAITVPSKYDFLKVKEHIATIESIKDKIAFLLEISTEYKQHKIFDWAIGTAFDEQCELEIKKLEKLLELDAKTLSNSPNFKLSDKKGARIDLIRICNALHNLKYLQSKNGDFPNKKEFMLSFGRFLGLDLSNYDADLSQAFNTGKVEPNIEVFDKMKAFTQSEVIKKLNKKPV